MPALPRPPGPARRAGAWHRRRRSSSCDAPGPRRAASTVPSQPMRATSVLLLPPSIASTAAWPSANLPPSCRSCPGQEPLRSPRSAGRPSSPRGRTARSAGARAARTPPAAGRRAAPRPPRAPRTPTCARPARAAAAGAARRAPAPARPSRSTAGTSMTASSARKPKVPSLRTLTTCTSPGVAEQRREQRDRRLRVERAAPLAEQFRLRVERRVGVHAQQLGLDRRDRGGPRPRLPLLRHDRIVQVVVPQVIRRNKAIGIQNGFGRLHVRRDLLAVAGQQLGQPVRCRRRAPRVPR